MIKKLFCFKVILLIIVILLICSCSSLRRNVKVKNIEEPSSIPATELQQPIPSSNSKVTQEEQASSIQSSDNKIITEEQVSPKPSSSISIATKEQALSEINDLIDDGIIALEDPSCEVQYWGLDDNGFHIIRIAIIDRNNKEFTSTTARYHISPETGEVFEEQLFTGELKSIWKRN